MQQGAYNLPTTCIQHIHTQTYFLNKIGKNGNIAAANPVAQFSQQGNRDFQCSIFHTQNNCFLLQSFASSYSIRAITSCALRLNSTTTVYDNEREGWKYSSWYHKQQRKSAQKVSSWYHEAIEEVCVEDEFAIYLCICENCSNGLCNGDC